MKALLNSKEEEFETKVRKKQRKKESINTQLLVDAKRILVQVGENNKRKREEI